MYDVAVCKPENITSAAFTHTGKGFTGGKGDSSVVRGTCRSSHGNHVVFEECAGLVYGHGSQGLHHRASRYHRNAMPLCSSFFRSCLGHSTGVTVAREHDDFRPFTAINRVENLARRRPTRGFGRNYDCSALCQHRRYARTMHNHHKRTATLGLRRQSLQVRNTNSMRSTDFHRGFDCGTRIVDMHVHVPQRIAANDHKRITQCFQTQPKRINPSFRGIKEIHDFISWPAVGLLRLVRKSGSSTHRHMRTSYAGKHIHHRVVDHHEACTTRVNDTGPTQRREHFGGLRESRASSGRTCLHYRHDTIAVTCLGRLCRRARDRENRAFNRSCHCAVGQVARVAQGAAYERAIESRSIRNAAKFLSEGAQNLSENDAGVASSSQQRTSRHGRADGRQRGIRPRRCLIDSLRR